MNLIAAGPIVTTQIAGKMQNDEREDHLDAGLRRRFFGALAALGPQRLGVHAQRLRDARAELVGLNQHRDERAEVVDAGAIGEVAQRLGAGLAGAQLEVDEPQLVGEIRIRERQLAADALQRLIEAEPGFDADDQQVERIGERQPDAVRAALGQPREHHAGQDVADAEAAERRAVMFGFIRSDVAKSTNSTSANTTRMPKKTVIASSRR